MLKALAIIGLMSLSGAVNSFANDSDRIDLLEKEIRDLKIRVSKLETPLSSTSSQQEPLSSGEGWKSVANWRKLTTSMGPKDVKKILGEPNWVKGGAVATWQYQNGGNVTFISDKAFSWNEPEQ
jgi:hypothetical protein